MQQVFTQFDGILPVHGFDVAADGAACTAGNGKVEPCGIGACLLGGDDLDGVAGFQLGTQGHHGIVDARGHGAVADIGVYRIGEVDGCSAFGQYQNLAFGGENIDFAGEEIDFNVFEKFDGIGAAGL